MKVRVRVMRNKKENSIYDRLLKTAKANKVKVVCMVDKVLLKMNDGRTLEADSLEKGYLTLILSVIPD